MVNWGNSCVISLILIDFAYKTKAKYELIWLKNDPTDKILFYIQQHDRQRKGTGTCVEYECSIMAMVNWGNSSVISLILIDFAYNTKAKY